MIEAIAGTAGAPLDAAALRAWIGQLAGLGTGPSAAVTDAERIDRIRALEEVKAACAAAQARESVLLDAAQRAAHAAAGVPAAQQGRGVAGQVALARRESPARGGQHLGLAKVLTAEMPHTLGALTRGAISEWRATLLARETACLDVQHRREIDQLLLADPATIEGYGDRRLIAEIQTIACRLDAAAVARRRSRAEAERRVTCRPAPDTMAILSALLPVAQGVAAYAALGREADTRVAAGDPRTRGQIMADALVERVTGQATASAVPVEVQLVMTSDTLFATDPSPTSATDPNPAGPAPASATGGSLEPALLPGWGPIPADLARELVAAAGESGAAWVRRLFASLTTGELVGMQSRRRLFPAGLARFIKARDHGFCRTPWCDAPIRHLDHVVPHPEGGPTSADNGQGLCQQCNHNRQAPGWAATRRTGPRHTLDVTTPTGHTYPSSPPRPPGSRPPTGRPPRDTPRRTRSPTRTAGGRRRAHSRGGPSPPRPSPASGDGP